ncbi:MAG: C69 family dipeptidase [Lachnospiraceae bacterium]|nr:C69 family dipeptidase [Lachnospiraceae bacterium]
MILMLTLAAAVNAGACTAVYVGREVSEDGTTLIAKSNDYQDNFANYVTITERVENQPGRRMPVDNEETVFAELPATTFRYTSTPFMDSTRAYNGLGKDATVCTNEYGVMMIMSITSFSNKAALQADPLIPSGLTEFTAVDLVVCQSKTAREAVEVLASLLDRYGSSEINIALIADQRETWYVEMYNGHQYAAVKLPEDRVCAFGNEFLLEYVSDYEDSMGHSDISVTMNTYTHLGLEDAVEEMSRMQDVENARKEQEKLNGKTDEVMISKNQFRAG